MDKKNKENGNNVEDKKRGNQAVIHEVHSNKDEIIRTSFLSFLVNKSKTDQFSFWKQGFKGVFEAYQDYKRVKDDSMDKFMAYETVVAGATDTVEYYVLIILSCLIATVGLYQNSVAIIIGAMIVAPLMGPIFGLSAGVLWGSGKVIWEALTTLFKGVIVVILITSVMTYLIPGIAVTSEMMARSRPTLFDILVALACGVVGAYAYVNNRVSSTVPGVAISVALMPPVCTMGIGIGLLDWNLASGSALLFLVNLLGISLSSLITFYIIRLNPRSENEDEKLKIRVRAIGQIVVSFAMLLLISIPLIYFTVTTIKENIEKQEVYNIFGELLPGEEIYSLDYVSGDTNSIDTVLLHNYSGPITNYTELKEALISKLGKPIALQVYTIQQFVEKQETSLSERQLSNLIIVPNK